MERTLDPQRNGTSSGSAGASSKPASSASLVLFHADLRRVGDVRVLRPAAAPPGSILAIGDRLLFWLGVLPDEPGERQPKLP